MMDETNGAVAIEHPVVAVVKESYADHVVADIEAAKARVRQAIDHYETQRREANEFHAQRISEIDAAVARLRGAMTETPQPESNGKRRGRWAANHVPLWGRCREALRGRGSVATRALAKELKAEQAAVIVALRDHADVFRVFKTDDGQMVELRG